MYHVYAISSLIKSYIYVGLTKDLDARMLRHNNGLEKTTRPFRPYRPFKLIYKEEAPDRPAARKKEKYWKSGTGKRQLRKMWDDPKKMNKNHMHMLCVGLPVVPLGRQVQAPFRVQ